MRFLVSYPFFFLVTDIVGLQLFCRFLSYPSFFLFHRFPLVVFLSIVFFKLRLSYSVIFQNRSFCSLTFCTCLHFVPVDGDESICHEFTPFDSMSH
jgi:hypothetical protein